MEDIKEIIENALHSVDFDEISKDMEASTGEKFPELKGVSNYYMFNSWDEFRFLILKITSKAFAAGYNRCIDPVIGLPFYNWFHEFIECVNPTGDDELSYYDLKQIDRAKGIE